MTRVRVHSVGAVASEFSLVSHSPDVARVQDAYRDQEHRPAVMHVPSRGVDNGEISRMGQSMF